jgi:hypothetical protein
VRTAARVATLTIALACALPPARALAQDRPAERGRGGTYLKVGLAHWQGDIFNESPLTQWNVDLFGTAYNLTSLNVEIESRFKRGLVISGFSLGYRKDSIRHVDSGHMVSLGLFRDVDLKVLALKGGGGIEWGSPALTFDQTEFEQAHDGTVRYRHVYPRRNAYVPFVGTRSDGAVYPFVSVSAVQRPGGLLLEAGMRVNIIRFHFDDYEVGLDDRILHAFSDRRVLVPYLFANLGIRLF